MARIDFKEIQVECYSGMKANERPLAFTYEGCRCEIQEIIDRWHEGGTDVGKPVINYFKVRTTDGKIYLLRYLAMFDVWSICI